VQKGGKKGGEEQQIYPAAAVPNALLNKIWDRKRDQELLFVKKEEREGRKVNGCRTYCWGKMVNDLLKPAIFCRHTISLMCVFWKGKREAEGKKKMFAGAYRNSGS